MAVNKVDCRDGRLTLHGDYVITHTENIEFKLEGDRIPSSLKGEKKGDLFLTASLVIFVNKSNNEGYQSISMPFDHIRGLEVKQPMFGANYLKGHVLAEPNGGWEGNADFKVVFNSGGAIEFAEAMQKAVRQAASGASRQPQGGFYPPPPLGGYYYPPYNSAYPAASQPYMGQPMAGQPMYPAPPAGQAPPPYPGPYAPPPQTASGISSGDAKAREAYTTGSNVYIPSYEAPPPYNPAVQKKTQ